MFKQLNQISVQYIKHIHKKINNTKFLIKDKNFLSNNIIPINNDDKIFLIITGKLVRMRGEYISINLDNIVDINKLKDIDDHNIQFINSLGADYTYKTFLFDKSNLLSLHVQKNTQYCDEHGKHFVLRERNDIKVFFEYKNIFINKNVCSNILVVKRIELL